MTTPTATPDDLDLPGSNLDLPNNDLDLPGNDLDPDTPTPEQQKKIPLFVKVYGLLCLIDGAITLPVVALLVGIIIWAVSTQPDLASIGENPTLTVIVAAIALAVAVVNAVCLIVFGASLLKNRRRHAARWSHVLLAITSLQIILSVMLQGIGEHLIPSAIQLGILLSLSITIDPSLHEERALQRRLRAMHDRDAYEAGTLGRDPEGKGYIELNFFNLFWVFMVCCVLGLLIEVAFHMLIVDPGVYQDRAGVLFGPFSPIYGFGAVLMTVALNRFYKANPLIILLVSAVIGGAFEYFVSWFMQTAFGVVAWDYTGARILGVADPIAYVCQGRTSTLFMLMWGVLGLFWIKLCLPHLLKLINLIPWKIRYSFTTVCAALMLVNGVMTLQALDCWFGRVSGMEPDSPVERFYAKHFDNEYMEHRFQSMTITPEHSSRVDESGVVDSMSGSSVTARAADPADGLVGAAGASAAGDSSVHDASAASSSAGVDSLAGDSSRLEAAA